MDHGKTPFVIYQDTWNVPSRLRTGNSSNGQKGRTIFTPNSGAQENEKKQYSRGSKIASEIGTKNITADCIFGERRAL
ncbi:hypothetical protein C8R45DRAFT_1012514 [Mycena sanguinolenta]|nr:hypothetical protein C8R45DRAFT_1012514 [Mycena sanguinolenta]